MALSLHALTSQLIDMFGGSGELARAVSETAKALIQLKQAASSLLNNGEVSGGKKGYDWGRIGTAATGGAMVGGAGTALVSGGLFSPVGVGVGALAGGGIELARQVYAKYSGGSGSAGSASIDSLLKFTRGSGDEEHYSMTNPGVRERFEAMVKEHGRRVTLTSSFRDQEEQARLYLAWKAAGGGPDNPSVVTSQFGRVTTPSPPDFSNNGKGSKHAKGQAFDIDNLSYRSLDRNGLLQKYGFTTVPGDEGHIEAQMMAKGGITNGISIAGEDGPEAVVPLPDGRNIPVRIDMKEMLAKFDEMIEVIKDHRDISEKTMWASA
jgi:hypothetical protein